MNGIEEGWFQGEIADAAYRFQQRVNSGEFVLVGVNGYTEGPDDPPRTLYVDPEVEASQLRELARVKQERDDERVRRALARRRRRRRRPDGQRHAGPDRSCRRLRHRRRGHRGARVGVRGWTERAYVEQPPTSEQLSAPPLRVLVAKVGLDGHDRGVEGRRPHAA